MTDVHLSRADSVVSTDSARDALIVNLDPIEFSVVLHRLNTILEEMTVALAQTAFSALLSLTHDFSCCMYDRQGRQLAMVDALPIHTNSMHLFLNEIAEFFGDQVHRGDIFVSNHPYAGNTHIGDLASAAPVFLDGEHLLWVAIRAHQLDVGAPVPHSSYAGAADIWQEGLKIPPLKLYDRGVARADVVQFYLQNLRWKDLLEGDLMAQLGATSLGVRRLEELCAHYGTAFVQGFVDEVIGYAARRSTDEIAAMPAGTYRGEAWYDEPAEGMVDVPIRCEVSIGRESIDIEFVDCPSQVARGVNASEAVLQAAGGIPVLMMIDADIPHNDGCLRRIQCAAPEGTICNATYPASTSMATIHPGDVMQEAVAKALAIALPVRAVAGTARWALIPMLSGQHSDGGGAWGHQLLNSGGGGGAALGADGWPLLTTSAARGGLRTASVEHTELLYPIINEEWEIEPDSMGLGEFIGGPGVRFTWRPLHASVELIYDSDGLRNPPFGLLGATPGSGGRAYVEDIDTGERHLLPPSVHTIVTPRQRWIGISSGGGGYGNPLDRPAERVAADVRDGLYSATQARSVFGVELGDEPEWALNEQMTTSLHEQLRDMQGRDGLAVVLPLGPGAAILAEQSP